MTVADKMRTQAAPTGMAEATGDPTWDTSWTDADESGTPKTEIRPESEDDHIARVVAVTGELVSSMPRDEGLFVIEQMIESETKRLYGRGLKAPDIAAYVRDIIGRVGFPLPEQALRRAVTRAITEEVASAGRLDFTATGYIRRLKEEVRRWDDADRFAFGIDGLDDSFGRLLPGELLVLVGAQGSMKSSLMLTGIEHYLQNNQNGTVMLFSLDMAPEVIAERLLQREMRATADRVRWHVKNETESFKCAMKKIRERYADRLLIYGSEAPTAQLMGRQERMTIDDLKNEVEAYMPSLVAVDYLTLLRKPRQSDLDCVNEVIPVIKEMAQKYGIMFLLLSQMGRASKQLQAAGSLYSGSAKGGGIVEELANAQIDLFKDAPIEPYGAPRIIATVSKTRRGVKFLQEALNVINEGKAQLVTDGIIGKKTLAALAEHSDALRSLCAVILWQRTLYYQSPAASKETFRTFLRGWINRLARLWQTCQ